MRERCINAKASHSEMTYRLLPESVADQCFLMGATYFACAEHCLDQQNIPEFRPYWTGCSAEGIVGNETEDCLACGRSTCPY
ncbi:MAG: hypothetical protein RR224_06030 [Clostridia bacterium]